MSDVAAHLVDEVLPKVPIRQWVSSLLWRLDYWMSYTVDSAPTCSEQRLASSCI